MNGLFQTMSIADIMKQVLGGSPGVLSDSQLVQGPTPMQMPSGVQPTVPQNPQGVLNNPQPDMVSPSQPAQAGQEEQGILSKIGNAFAVNKENFGNRIGNGLIAAGSLDPSRAFANLEAADAEQRPKPLQLPNGDIVLVYPDGRVEKQAMPEQQDFLKQKWDAQTMAGIQKLIAAGDIKKAFEVFQDAAKGAGGASATQQDPVAFKQSIEQTDNVLKAWTDQKTGNVKEDNPNKIMGIESPLLAGIRDKYVQQLAPDLAPESAKQRRELDMFMKGQVAKNLKEMGSNPSTADLRFKVEQFPDPYKDSAETITTWVKNYKEWLQAEENLRKQNVGKKDAMLPASAVPNAIPSTPAGDAYKAWKSQRGN